MIEYRCKQVGIHEFMGLQFQFEVENTNFCYSLRFPAAPFPAKYCFQ